MIGHTPLMDIGGFTEGAAARVVVKLEYKNPAGSSKDRIGLALIKDAVERGLLAPGGTVIEPTSGNTGIGIASACAALGYRAVIVMPDSMSAERRKLMGAYGAELVLTPGAQGMAGAIAKAQELKESIPGSIIAGQFVNPANPRAHFETTGPEIWEDTDGKVDIFAAAMGTGGTVSGVGRFLKSRKPEVKVVGIEPKESPLVSEGRSGPHGIQGIGPNFVPDTLDRGILDEVLTVTTADAYSAARNFARSAGVLVGISSGAALAGALELAKRPENAGKLIVALLPDSGERYLSVQGLFD
ncbi:MAG: cysteine synthase A [Oscillospiraceae bacterium]|nr:cysteine synthase A [Oscillospiraceae bacterium]